MINVYKSRIKSNLKISTYEFIEDYLKDKLLYLREYVDLRDSKSASIYNDLLDSLIDAETFEQIKNIFEEYENKLEKSAYDFIIKDNLIALCDGYWDNYLEDLLKEATIKLSTINLDNNNEILNLYSYYVNKILIRKSIIEHKMKLQSLILNNPNINIQNLELDLLDKCRNEEEIQDVYLKLQKEIKKRIEYSKKVSTKLDEFIKKCKENKKNSYTIPYINSRVKDLYKYYNEEDNSLYIFDNCLSNLEKEIKYQSQRDQIKAALKKFRIEHQLLTSKDDRIFSNETLNELRKELRNINTFGGFASLKNKMEKEEMLEYINTIDNILKQNNSILKKDKTISNRKQRRILIDQAFVALERIKDQIDSKIDNELLKSELAYLSIIDYVNDNINDIVISILV
jgi:hypothetical protein